jgi:hypothetical protein
VNEPGRRLQSRDRWRSLGTGAQDRDHQYSYRRLVFSATECRNERRRLPALGVQSGETTQPMALCLRMRRPYLDVIAVLYHVRIHSKVRHGYVLLASLRFLPELGLLATVAHFFDPGMETARHPSELHRLINMMSAGSSVWIACAPSLRAGSVHAPGRGPRSPDRRRRPAAQWSRS